MVRSIQELRDATDAELIAEHDHNAKTTIVGTAYYMEELDRRSRDRATAAAQELSVASLKLARRSFWIAVSGTSLSAVAAIAAVMSLILRPVAS